MHTTTAEKKFSYVQFSELKSCYTEKKYYEYTRPEKNS